MTSRAILMSIVAIVMSIASFAGGAAPQRMTFTERSPLRTVEELERRSDYVQYWFHMEPGCIDYDLANETFNVYVPPSYSRGSPHGIFVWNGVTEFNASWLDILARHRLIFVDIPNVAKRNDVISYGLCVEAVHNLKRLYSIDESRVYLSGFSGGGLCAAKILHAFPDVYRGAFFINGEDFYNGRWSEEGKLEPMVREYPRWGGPLDYETLKKRMRIVILTGEKDPVFEPDISRSNYEGLWMDGFRNVTYFEIPRGGHNHPDDNWFERGINALDHPQAKPPPTTSPTNVARPLPGQNAQAKRLLSTAQELIDGRNAPYEAFKAPGYLEQLLKDYPTAPAAATARELLEWTKRNPAKPWRRPTTASTRATAPAAAKPAP